jgi:hypothetical protein
MILLITGVNLCKSFILELKLRLREEFSQILVFN